MVQITFNAAEHDPNVGSASIFETGEYTFCIVQSDVKNTKDNRGTMLVFELECVDNDPSVAKKRFTQRLNVQNENADAVRIAFQELSAICHVVGVLQMQDTQQLHGRPFKLRLEKAPRRDDPSKFTNNVQAIMDVNGNPPRAGQPSGGGGAPVAPPQAPAPATAPAAPAAPSYTPPPQAQAPAAPAPAPAPSAPPATQPWGNAAPAAPAPSGTPPWATPSQ